MPLTAYMQLMPFTALRHFIPLETCTGERKGIEPSTLSVQERRSAAERGRGSSRVAFLEFPDWLLTPAKPDQGVMRVRIIPYSVKSPDRTAL